MSNHTPRTIHGIDLTAPGGLDALFAYRRAQFGDAVMSIAADAGDAPAGGEGQAPVSDPNGTPDAPEGNDGKNVDENGREAARSGNVWDDPDAARAEIERLRKENARDRTTAKETAAQEARESLVKEFGKILGYETDDTQGQAPDVDRVRADLEAQKAAAQEARLSLSVYQAAADPAVGANANALLDSRAFLDSVKDLDPSDGEAITKAIRAAVEKNPHLAATPTRQTPPGRSGGEVPGGQGTNRPRATTLSEALGARYGYTR